jgi:hypothetical protein
MKKLKQKYSKHNFDNITEKNIIYFCRDALSYYASPKDPDYEKEILELIKQKDYDWFINDNDGNIILTYPILNDAFTILDYLISNKKYDLSVYNNKINDSILASIRKTGKKMIKYLLNQNIHPNYITNMALTSFKMSDHISSPNNYNYIKNALFILNKAPQTAITFEYIFSNMIRNPVTSGNSLIYLLNEHKLNNNEKIQIIDLFFEEDKNSRYPLKLNKIEEKIKTIEKWKFYLSLIEKYEKPELNQNIRKKI